MYILDTEMEAINLDLFADYAGIAEETTAPVVDLYSDTPPAPAAAINPFVEEVANHKAAIQATLSELNSMILKTADTALRSQVKTIATGLVGKSGLMQQTKENYLHMLEAAEANAAFYYGKPVQDVKTATVITISPYKRKYDTANDISQHLATASILKEVASLYYVNAELIEATLWLKKQFTDRKARLYRPSTAAA